VRVMVLGVRGIPNVEGGVETHAQQLYTRLAQSGCDVEVMVRAPFVKSRAKWFGPVRLRRLWSPRTTGLEAFVHSVLGVFYAGFRRPDLLHIHAIGPAIVTPIARLFGLRVVVTNHGPDYERDKWGSFARWVLRQGESMGSRHANACIAISQVIAERMRSQYGRECDLIRNGAVAARHLSQTDELERHGLEDGKYFLQVSRIVPEKRQLDLIDAYARARPEGWKLVLVGGLDGGNYSRRVEAAARQCGAILTGFKKGTALEQLFSHAGAFVLPSSHEGLPIVILEALSYGLPVLASAIPANLEIGLGETNYFPAGDIDALAIHLQRLAAAPQDETTRKARQRWVAEKFDWDRIAAETLSVYQRVLEGRRQLLGQRPY